MNKKLACLLAGLCLFPPFSLAVPHSFFVGKGNPMPFRCFEDDRGGFFLVWIAGAGDQDKEYMLRTEHIDSKGTALWDALPNEMAGQGLVVSPRLSSFKDWSGFADGKGGLTLFWDEKDGVHAQRFGADGARREKADAVLFSTSAVLQPDAVPDALGGTLLVWRQAVQQTRTVIMAQRLDNDFNPMWQAGGIRISLRASHQSNPRVVYDNVSGMIAAWRDEGNNASELRVQRIDFDGNRLWGLEGLKIGAPMGQSEYPALTPSGTGSGILAWTTSVNQTNQILLQLVGPQPQLKWGDGVYSSREPAAFNRWNPVLLGDQAGGTWVGWEDFSNQVNFQIQLNRLDKQGSSVWTGGEIQVAPCQGEQGKMAMVADGNEGVWLAWIDSRLSTIGLYVQEIDSSGQRLQGPRGHLIADQLKKPSFPELVSLSLRKVAVVWTDRPKKDQWTLSWEVSGNP